MGSAMKRGGTRGAKVWCAAFVALWILAASADAQDTGAGNGAGAGQASQAAKKEPFWKRALRTTGVAYNPSSLKGPGDEVATGEVWVAEVGSGTTRKLTAEGGFRSPVFSPKGNDVFVLKGTEVMRLGRTGGEARKVCAVAGAYKLVGFSMDDGDKVLVVTEDDAGRSGVALLSIATGKTEALPYDAASAEDRRMVEHLRSWDRVYGDASVYVKRRSKETLAGTEEWLDVFLKAGAGEAVDVSNCDGVNCGQPSLAPDGKLVAFVKSD
jgi:hypothetical protein